MTTPRLTCQLIKMRSPKPDDSYLLRLPNEILHLCFEQVAYLDRELAIGYDSKEHTQPGLHQGQINVEGQYALAFTCRRFHDLVVPILYTTVRLDAHEFCQNWSHQRALFVRTIDEHPPLKQHIKDLTINWNFEVVGLDTIRYLTKFSSLERLAVWKMKLEPGMIGCPLPEEKGTSSLTDISFQTLLARPADLKLLLEWPRNLHSFGFGYMPSDDYDLDEQEEWNYGKLTDALEPQRESLRVFNIGYLPGYRLDLDTFSTRVFPQLHTLSLNMREKQPSQAALGNWLSPSIQTLIFDLPYYSQRERFSRFAAISTQNMMRVGCWARKIKARGGGENLERIGIKTFEDGSEGIRDERHCIHECGGKRLLIKALESLEHHGFQSFWIGPSGFEYTAREMRGFCQCDGEARG